MTNDRIPVLYIIQQKDNSHNKTSPLESKACFIVLYYTIFAFTFIFDYTILENRSTALAKRAIVSIYTPTNLKSLPRQTNARRSSRRSRQLLSDISQR